MNSKLLEEAIVDAKALKEAAIKNAEQAVLEKYAPEVKNAIQNLLEQDEIMDDPLAEEAPQEEEGKLDVSQAAMDGEELCPCPDDDEVVMVNISALKKSLADASRAGKVDEEEEPQEAAPLVDLGGEEEKEEEQEQEQEEEAPELPALQEEKQLTLESDEEIEIEDSLLESLLSEEEIVVDAESDTKVSTDKTNEEVSRAADLEESKKQNSKMLVENKKVLKENKLLTEKLTQLLEQHKELLEENKKVKETALQISQRLEESNLMNAKLFYKNQTLGSDSLNERQKNKIVEALSKAGSVDETRMIYETLSNAVGSFSNKGPQSLSEAVETRGSMVIKSSQEKTSNANPVYEKWQKIAGIKK